MKKETYIFFCNNIRDKSMCRPFCGGENTEHLYEYCRKIVKDNKHLLNENHYVKVTKTGCLGKCEQGPNIVVFPENRWYKYSSEEEIDKILKENVFSI